MDKDTKDIIESLDFIKEKMATKSDLKKVDDRVKSVESKVEGINKRLDVEAQERQDQNVPKRVTAIEKHVGIHTAA